MFAWIILESIVSIPNGYEILMVSLAFDLNFLSLKNTHKKQQPLKIVCEGHAVLCIMRISASISICLLDTNSQKNATITWNCGNYRFSAILRIDHIFQAKNLNTSLPIAELWIVFLLNGVFLAFSSFNQ